MRDVKNRYVEHEGIVYDTTESMDDHVRATHPTKVKGCLYCATLAAEMARVGVGSERLNAMIDRIIRKVTRRNSGPPTPPLRIADVATSSLLRGAGAFSPPPGPSRRALVM